MRQDDKRYSGTARSRAKGSSRNASGTRNVSSRSTATRRTKTAARKKRGSEPEFVKLAAGGLLLIAAICTIVFFTRGSEKQMESVVETTTVPETELAKEVLVDGISITGLSREEAKRVICEANPWNMAVVWGEKRYEVADLITEKIDALLQEIYAGEPKEQYTLNTDGLEDAIEAEAAAVAYAWDQAAKNGSISSYDAQTDTFLFAGSENGYAVDQEQLTADLLAALKEKQFDAEITAKVDTVEPEFSTETAKEKYQILAKVTTTTTANKKRNTNIKLSAEAIHGTILQPGEEFSFNDVVGQRTAEKGYQGAAAYNNGEVVEEIGGGVCQVSSTLYNAVLKAGLETTFRRSHTYEPSYVTPGTDATVSWGGPDYKFKNTSSAAIGLRATYADQKMTVSIYGIPVLEDGVTYELQSTKIKEVPSQEPVYEEDGTLEPGVEVIKSAGSLGSVWETRLVIKKNGEIISQEVDHKATYKGHAPVILRNTSGTVAPTESLLETETTGETTAGETSATSGEIGPGITTAAPTETTKATAPTHTESATAPVQPGGTVGETTAETTKAENTSEAESSTAESAQTGESQETTTAAPSETTASASETTSSGGDTIMILPKPEG